MNVRFLLFAAILAGGCAGANRAVAPSPQETGELHIYPTPVEPAAASQHDHHQGHAAEATAASPSRTLKPDPVDAPAPTSIEEATRAAALAREMGGHHAHGSATYRQIDAGRESVPDRPPAKPDPPHHHAPEPEKEKP